MADAKLVVVWEYGSRMEADVAMSMLEAAGIEGFSQADTAGGMREHLAWSGAGFKILVREEDVAAAREILTAPSEGFGPDFDEHNEPLPPWRKFT
jgi:Putative prokaryotic signal transducing protein